MKAYTPVLTLSLLLAGCEKYTEKTSPCFGTAGTPIVSRIAQTPLLFTAPIPSKDCTFEPIGSAQQ